MRILRESFLLFIITFLGVSTIEPECYDTKYVLSRCYDSDKYQWLIEVPETETSCEGQSIAKPVSVTCNLKCRKGEAFDKIKLGCKTCPSGTYGIGDGQQYVFNSFSDVKSLPPEISLGATSFMSYDNTNCDKNRLWQIKGNALQGDVQSNCAVMLSLKFKLVRPGSITITYNLATSYVFGSIKSRCDFAIDDDDDDDDDDSGSKKSREFNLQPTGYGVWNPKQININEAGEYKLSLFTVSLNALHFPFAIRSIIVEGSPVLPECVPCAPGTYAEESGSYTCKPCEVNTYASKNGSTECLPCKDSEYADEGSAKCKPRPTCTEKHYRKVFIGCESSDTAAIKYEPIQPQICIGGGPPPDAPKISCGSCNPGMYKQGETGKCTFCPSQTYSNGTFGTCEKCTNELSLLRGLYYKNWRELPAYLNRSYMSFNNPVYANRLTHSHSWIPSISYISSQAIPDTLSVLSLWITKGFRLTDISKSTREYGTLYFNFSMQCQSSCTLFLVSRNIYDDDDDWEVLNKWKSDKTFKKDQKFEYTYSIQHPDEIIFDWLFSSDGTQDSIDEIRIYEIRVTNTELGGSDRCVPCLTDNNQETQCKACTPGFILLNNTCIPCQSSTIATRVRPTDPVPTICKPCPSNTISDDGISCYSPCKQSFNGSIEYDLNTISTLEFHGSKLFTQKGSGYFHVFNASICGKTSVTCSKASTSIDSKRSINQMITDSKLCREGSVPDKNGNVTSVAYIDEFGEQILNISLSTLKYFPPLRSDYNLTDITLVYRANATAASQSTCSERITFLSLRCDHILEEEKLNSTLKYQLQTPNDCSSGTCDGCTFYFLLRTPFACPTCDENTNGFRTFVGPCKFGRQEVRKIPYPYCSHKLTEKVENRRCSILSLEIQIIIGLFIIIAGVLISLVIFCWRKNRKLEYRYMQLIENNNPDDDAPVDNVCAQLSDEDDEEGEVVQFKTQSKAKKLMNVVRKAIRKSPSNGRSDMFSGDSFLLTNTQTDDA